MLLGSDGSFGNGRHHEVICSLHKLQTLGIITPHKHDVDRAILVMEGDLGRVRGIGQYVTCYVAMNLLRDSVAYDASDNLLKRGGISD